MRTPRDEALSLTETFNSVRTKLFNASQQLRLLDGRGRVPAHPSYAELLGHAADAQDLSRDVVRLAALFAQGPHSTTRAGQTVLAHLAKAANASSHAAPRFLDTAQVSLRLDDAFNRQYLEESMVMDHDTGRSFLRRASEFLRDAARELERVPLSPASTQRQGQLPPPPQVTGRHR